VTQPDLHPCEGSQPFQGLKGPLARPLTSAIGVAAFDPLQPFALPVSVSSQEL
jgi:hypothetical protein